MFAIVDIETTGNNFKYGQITEIAIYQHDGLRITNSFSTLIKPETDIPYFTTKITGITNEMVKNAPRFYEAAETIANMTDGRTFVAHNAHFDYNFLREEYKRLGYNFQRKTLCTVKLSRKFLKGHKSYSLGKICAELGIEINGRHRAASDALATVRLFEIILKENEKQIKNAAAGKLLF